MRLPHLDVFKSLLQETSKLGIQNLRMEGHVHPVVRAIEN